MAWKLVELPDSDADPEDFSNDELVSLYLLLQHRMEGPYDDSNPEFTSYLKLTMPFNAALRYKKSHA